MTAEAVRQALGPDGEYEACNACPGLIVNMKQCSIHFYIDSECEPTRRSSNLDDESEAWLFPAKQTHS